MTEFNWYIDSLPVYVTKNGKTNVVSKINWRCEAVEDNVFSAFIEGILSVQLSPTSFVDYDQLTENTVWAWVYAKVNKQTIEENLQLAIDAQKTSKPVILSLPWVA
jgi:hypothetical protein